MTCVTSQAGNRITAQHVDRRGVTHRTGTRIATRGQPHTNTAERRHYFAMRLLQCVTAGTTNVAGAVGKNRMRRKAPGELAR